MSPPAAADSSDDALRQAVQGFAAQVGPVQLQQALQQMGAAMGAAMGAVHEVLGDYRIGRELGRGGMGVVYEAEQISVPGRKVAVKVLLGWRGSDTARQRFAREVALVGQLDHPHIVPILSADLAASQPFYAMKKVDGVSLREMLDTGAMRGEYRRMAALVRDLAWALDHAHGRGVVHRDVKPGNVMLDQGGCAMLLDFGLARAVEAASDLTGSLDAVGTPDYMAPEQVSRRFGPITPRTDVYGLGVTLFQCLTDRTPFAGRSRSDILDRIVRGATLRLRSIAPGVPRDLETICAKAMERDPARRYATAAAFATDLDAFLAGQPVQARPAGWLRRARGLARRHPLPAAAAGAATLMLLMAYGYWGWWQPRSAAWARLAQVEALWHDWRALAEQDAGLLADITRRQEQEPHPGHDAGLGRLQLAHRRLRLDQDRLEGEIESALEACLALDPRHVAARAHAADLVALQLRRLLQGSGAVSRRDQIDRQQQRLRRLDSGQRHAELLDARGDLAVRCERATAQVWLCRSVEEPDGRLRFAEPGDPAALDLGQTPVGVTVAEGSYALRARAAGYEPTVVPVLVRRRAVQSGPERNLLLQPLAASEIGLGYRQVHGGFMVAAMDRTDPLLQREELYRVGGFAMTEREVRVQDVVAWLGEPPPFLTDAVQKNGMLAGVDWPQVAALLHALNRDEQRRATGYYVTLPTPEQWQWAGQGADGRPYPWGWLHDWRFSQNYWSSVDPDMALRQEHWPDTDISPFGIRDLAGSAREVLLPEAPMRAMGNKQFLLGGGCYYSFRADDLTLWPGRSMLKDVRSFDVGLRLVRLPLPAVPSGPRTLRLAPGREPLTGGIPAGWRITGSSGPFFEDLAGSARARIEAGCLAVHGFAGSYSPQIDVWHGLSAPSAATKVEAEFALHGDQGLARSIELRLGVRPQVETHDHWLGCSVHRASLAIGLGGIPQPWSRAQALPETSHQSYRLRLAVDPATVSCTLWRGAEPPVVHRIERPPGLPAEWNYVALRLPNFIGLRVVIRELSVDGG